jgi:F0F1-type ATP synthase delta subunit
MVDSDQIILVDYAVDPDILGGLTLLVGTKFQDLSVRSAITMGERTLRSM